MKKFLGVVLSGMMILSMTACGGTKEADTTKQAPAADTNKEAPAAETKQDVTISYMASQDWVMDAEMKLGEKFTEETGIKIDYQIIPSDQYSNLLLTKLNAGEGTDIFGSQSGSFDIQSQINVEKTALDLSGEAWASIIDPLVAKELSVNGKLYGQPTADTSSVWGIAYNKKIFTDLNLEIPKTYDEFKAVCEKIKAGNITPIYECVSDGWHHVLWYPEIGPAFEKATPGLADKLNTNAAKFVDDATMKKALSQIKEMVDLGYWGENYMSNTYADAPKNIASGKYAMFVANQGFAAEVNAADPNFNIEDIGYFVIPLVDNQILNMNPCGPSRFVYSGSKNADAAKKYLEFMAKPENLQYMIDNVPKYNTLPYTGVKDKYTQTIKDFYNTYQEKGTVYQVAVKYLNPQWMDIGKDLTGMLVGDTTPETILQNIDKKRNDQATAANDTTWK
jgi:raffinose/stachyose/melibiose transport system substrate-binding protein